MNWLFIFVTCGISDSAAHLKLSGHDQNEVFVGKWLWSACLNRRNKEEEY